MDYRTVGLSDCRTIELSDYRIVGLSDYRTVGLYPLSIEKARHHQNRLDRSERLCQNCSLEKIEDESQLRILAGL
jgi:hypothetical protein